MFAVLAVFFFRIILSHFVPHPFLGNRLRFIVKDHLKVVASMTMEADPKPDF